MNSKNCLNCEKELTDKFCSGCGQASDTHRITFKNFIFHDVLHGTFHLERGILFTAKQALLRPGTAALEYIAGKRKRFYNVFYLILITIGLLLFVRHFYQELLVYMGNNPAPAKQFVNEASKSLDDIFAQKSKLIIFLFVPLTAINSYFLFKRKKLNLSEHAVLSGMILLGILLLALFGNLFFYFDLLIEFSSSFANAASLINVVLILLYIGYGYYNAFANVYSKWAITYNIVLFFVMLFLELCILFLTLYGFLTHWKFGEITFHPFG